MISGITVFKSSPMICSVGGKGSRLPALLGLALIAVSTKNLSWAPNTYPRNPTNSCFCPADSRVSELFDSMNWQKASFLLPSLASLSSLHLSKYSSSSEPISWVRSRLKCDLCCFWVSNIHYSECPQSSDFIPPRQLEAVLEFGQRVMEEFLLFSSSLLSRHRLLILSLFSFDTHSLV